MNSIPFILLDAIQSDKGIFDSSHGLHWLAQSLKTVPQDFFGMTGKSIVKNQTVDFPHFSLLIFGPKVKNMMQQAAMFQISHFSSFFFCSFIYTRSPWSLIDHSESPIGILKAKVHAIYGKDKTNSSKNCWRISTVLIE